MAQIDLNRVAFMSIQTSLTEVLRRYTVAGLEQGSPPTEIIMTAEVAVNP